MNLRLLETSHRTSPLWILYIYIYLRERKKHREVRTMAGFIVPPTHSTQENSPNFGSLNHLTAVTNGPWADSPNKMIIWILICCKLPAKPSKLATNFFEEPFQPIWKNLTSEDRKKVIWKDAYIYIYIYIIWIICISTEKLLLQESAFWHRLHPAARRLPCQATIPPLGGLGSMLPLAGGARNDEMHHVWCKYEFTGSPWYKGRDLEGKFPSEHFFPAICTIFCLYLFDQ